MAVYARYIARTAPKLLGRRAAQGPGPGRHAGLRAAAPGGGRRAGHVVELPGRLRLLRRIRRAGRRERARAPSRRAVRAVRDVGPLTWLSRRGCRRTCGRSCWVPGRTIGTAVVDRADAVAFTGSTAAGRAIAARTGPRLDQHVPGARRQEPVHRAGRRGPRPGRRGRDRRACFINAGQTCVGPERILVQRGRLRGVPRQAGRPSRRDPRWAGT